MQQAKPFPGFTAATEGTYPPYLASLLADNDDVADPATIFRRSVKTKAIRLTNQCLDPDVMSFETNLFIRICRLQAS